MRKVFASGVLAAAIAVGALFGAGSANADTASFVSALHDDGWGTYSGSDDSLINTGWGVCRSLNAGYSEYAIQNYVYVHTGSTVSWSDAGQFVATAEDHLCASYA